MFNPHHNSLGFTLKENKGLMIRGKGNNVEVTGKLLPSVCETVSAVKRDNVGRGE